MGAKDPKPQPAKIKVPLQVRTEVTTINMKDVKNTTAGLFFKVLPEQVAITCSYLVPHDEFVGQKDVKLMRPPVPSMLSKEAAKIAADAVEAAAAAASSAMDAAEAAAKRTSRQQPAQRRHLRL